MSKQGSIVPVLAGLPNSEPPWIVSRSPYITVILENWGEMLEVWGF